MNSPTSLEQRLLAKNKQSLYFLRCNDRARTLSLYIHTSCIGEITERMEKRPHYSESHFERLSEYHEHVALNGIQGFNGCASRTEIKEFTRLDFTLPQGGHQEHYGSLLLIAHSISLLLDQLETYVSLANQSFDEHYPTQNYVLLLQTTPRSKGFSVYGGVSGEFLKLMKRLYTRVAGSHDELFSIKGADQAMRTIRRHLMPKIKNSNDVFAGIRDDRLLLQASMGATQLGIWPNERMSIYFINSRGAAISCHNTDHAISQMVLLAGFVKLAERIVLE